MNSGKIVEEGTHDELMEMNKEYTAMVNSALLTTEDDEKKVRTPEIIHRD